MMTGLVQWNMPWLTAPLVVLTGLFVWTFFEYGMHNWRGHKGRGRSKFSREHLKHHSHGDFFPPMLPKVFIALAITLILTPALALLIGLLHAASLTMSFVGSYIFYEILHRRLHTHAPRNAYGRWARRHHFHHHFVEPQLNHGVTTPIWDLVFGTHTVPGPIKVPERLAMDWLLDAKTGDVAAAYASDYVLVRQADRRRAARRKVISAADAVSSSRKPALTT